MNIRFQNGDAPKTLYVDRGKGFYHMSFAIITGPFKAALQECGVKSFWGDDASQQPGELQEIMLHETAVRWIRCHERRTLPRKPWEETEEQFVARLKSIAAYINKEYDVEGLTRGFPKRIDALLKSKGERIHW